MTVQAESTEEPMGLAAVPDNKAADLHEEVTEVTPARLPDLGQGTAPSGPTRDLRMLADIPVEVAVELGRMRLPLRDLLALGPGAVFELDRPADSPVDVLVNGRLVARGEVVVIDGEFGVRVTSVVEDAS